MGSGSRIDYSNTGVLPGNTGLLALDGDHPSVGSVFSEGKLEDEFDVEKEPIARGKFAAVRRAKHRVTGEVYAAKYVRRRRRAKTTEAEAEARHEVAVLMLGRHHKHIAHLHRVYLTRQEYIIILEFGAGGDLQKYLDEQLSLPEQTARDLMVQVLKGLRFLHSNRIAHLDIKPQNLIMMGDCPEQGVKLVDFGLSRVTSNDAELQQIMGTPDYVAPEVINFEPVGLATDMWSIGVLTYVFLSGWTPFGGENDQETFVNITQAEYEFPEESFACISEQAKDFISCLLLKKPHERLSVEDCLNHPWLSIPAPAYPLHTPHLYTVPENETQADQGYLGDSAYSSDSNNGSPNFLEQTSPPPSTFTSSLTVTNICQCPIPEETNKLEHDDKGQETNRQVARISAAASMLSSAKRLRNRGSYMSVDMEDTLKAVRKQKHRSARRASLVIDDYNWGDVSKSNDRLGYSPNKLSQTRISNHHQSLLNLNQTMLDDRSLGNRNSDEFYNFSNRLRHSESYDCTIGGSMMSRLDCQDQSDYPNDTLQNDEEFCAKPWEKICTGSVLRAVNSLTTTNRTSSPKKKRLSQSKTDLTDTSNCRHNDTLSYSNSGSPQKSDLKKSRLDFRSSKNDLRASFKGCENGEKSKTLKPKSGLKSSRFGMRGSDLNLSLGSWELRHPSNDINSFNKLDMSLSRLDLAHEQLNDDEELERLDSIRGDLTLPRRTRVNRTTPFSPLLRNNSLHMSFRIPKNRKY